MFRNNFYFKFCFKIKKVSRKLVRIVKFNKNRIKNIFNDPLNFAKAKTPKNFCLSLFVNKAKELSFLQFLLLKAKPLAEKGKLKAN